MEESLNRLFLNSQPIRQPLANSHAPTSHEASQSASSLPESLQVMQQTASQPASQRGLGRSGLEAMSMSRLAAIVALLSLGCSISFCSFLEPGHPLELWLGAVKVVGEYIVHSAAVVEDGVSYLSSVRLLWLVALALVSFFGTIGI